MRYQWIRLLSFALCAVLLFGMVGCTPKQPDTSSDLSDGSTDTPSGDGSSETPAESEDPSADAESTQSGTTAAGQKPDTSSGTTKAPTPAAGEAMQAVVTFGEKTTASHVQTTLAKGADLDKGTLLGRGYWQLMKGNSANKTLYLTFDAAFKKNIEKYNLMVLLEYYGDNSDQAKILLSYTAAGGKVRELTHAFSSSDKWTGSAMTITDFASGSALSGHDMTLTLGDRLNQMKLTSVKIVKKSKQAVKYPALVSPKYVTDRAIVAAANVQEYGALGDGKSDDTVALLMAIANVHTAGGGVVYLPAGTYLLTQNIDIPDSVILQGDWASPKQGMTTGTVLKLMPNTTAQGTTESFFRMRASAGLKNVVIWYPEQTLSGGKATPYPVTIEMLEQGGITVEDVCLLNVYDGIKMGPNMNALQTIRNVYGTPLHEGMMVDHNVDIARFENIYFAPDYWANSKLAGAPAASALKSWLIGNASGLVMKRIDWAYVTGLNVDGYKVGLHLTRDKNGNGNGQVYGTVLKNCNTCILVDETFPYGYTFTDCTLSAAGGSDPVAVRLKSTFSEGALSFHTVSFTSAGKQALLIEGGGQVSLESCRFAMTSSGAAYAVENRAGRLTMSSCTFTGSGSHVLTRQKAAKTVLSNCMTASTLKLTDQSGGKTVTSFAAEDKVSAALPKIAASALAQKAVRPSGKAFANLQSYGAKAGSSTDVGPLLQKAINDVAAAGGGVVYVPYGAYRLESAVTVKSGVEVKGSNDTPHHSSRRAATFLTDFGRNKADGTALFTLQSKAGLSGFTVFYDKQDSAKCCPYAYTVRGAGSGVYVVNVTLCYTYQGIDLKTNRCDDHYIEGVGMGALVSGVAVGGGSRNGIVRDVQANVHYITDVPYPGGKREGGDAGFDRLLYYAYEPFSVENSRNEMLFNNFIWGSWHGVAIKGGKNVTVLGMGCDNSVKGIYLTGCEGETVNLINSQLVCLGGTGRKSYIYADAKFRGTANVFNTTMWGTSTLGAEVSGGRVNLTQGVMVSPGGVGVLLNNGHVSVSGMLIGNCSDAVFYIEDSATAADSSYKAFGNLVGAGTLLKNRSGLIPQGSDLKK